MAGIPTPMQQSKTWKIRKYKYNLLAFSSKGIMRDLRHPSMEENCSIYSPIEGGFRGVYLSLFLFLQDSKR